MGSRGKIKLHGKIGLKEKPSAVSICFLCLGGKLACILLDPSLKTFIIG